MPEPEVELPENAAEAVPASGSRRWPYVLTIVLALFGLAVVALWVQRENLAHRIIGKQLEQYDLPATYKLEQVGPLTQVITGVVVGDPARPDFTAERVEIRIAPTLGLPTIGSVRLVKARLYGSYKGGKLSFGALDKVFFAPSTR
ncbi:MAG: exoprotein, partial [Novosphingobium sp.]